MTNRIRYTLDEIRRNVYYQMPKFLFEGELENMSNDARVLYSLLRDRHELSIKNQWVNESGEVYMIFSRENMCEMLKLSRPTITKAMNDLKKYNLIDEKRLGQGKVNHIYLLMVDTSLTYEKKPETLENTKKERIFPSERKEFFHQEGKNFSPINNDIKEIYVIETESKSTSTSDQTAEGKNDMTMTIDIDTVGKDIPPANEKGLQQTATPTKANGLQSPPEKLQNTHSLNDDYTMYKRLIQDNIEYDQYIHSRPTEIELVDELVNCMLDVICTNGDTVKINGEQKNRNMVKSQYLKVNAMDIDHILDRYKEQHHKITHLNAYLKTMLYTVRQENGHYYTNAVRADGLVW